MQNTFYWYDLETFGIDSKADRIAQFAGLRTDSELNPIGDADMFYCQMANDYLPNPYSCVVTGITAQTCNQNGYSEAEFATKIHQLFSRQQTCVVGYNSIRFDDEFIRNLFYRNLFDPYQREYANGNSRWDLIDLVRACHALRPQGINWPTAENGAVSFKLERLSEANQLDHQSAHDALSDVEATIQMARLIKQKQPDLFDFYLKLRNKNSVRNLLNRPLQQPIVHISGKIPAARGCLSIFVPLAEHPTNKNGIICYDLNYDPQALIELSTTEIRDRIYTPQAELPEGIERIHLKTIHLNKSPFVAPLSTLKGVDLSRFALDYQQCQQHLQQIKQASQLPQKVSQVFDQPFPADTEDVDAMLYSGFFSHQDRMVLENIRGGNFEQIDQQIAQIKDPRGEQLVKRYQARNFPQSLNPEQQTQWQQATLIRLEQQHGKDFENWFKILEQCRNEHPEQQEILDQLEQFVLNGEWF